ncbi:MAG: hypothetical protein JW723_06185 [Bacteroidales bacterium]|nr:hypothetical protein [Bacteroidales bacterium]
MKFSILIISLLISIPLYGQKILLDKDVTKAYQNIKGPNTKSFKQLYFGVGMVAGNTPDLQINNIKSGYFSVGFRQKFKILSFYSAGFEIGYSALHFNIKQAEDKYIPNSELHDKEKLRFHDCNLQIFNRINIGKRGNVIGRFIDIGGYTDYFFSSSHYTKDKIEESASLPRQDVFARVQVVKNSRLDYVRPFGYGVFGRAGINWFAVKVTYRMSDLFEKKYDWSELPRVYVGLELTLPN